MDPLASMLTSIAAKRQLTGNIRSMHTTWKCFLALKLKIASNSEKLDDLKTPPI